MYKYFIGFLLLLSTSLYAKLNVIVSIAPQVVFTKAIGGDKIDISLMVTPGNSPHTYEPKPSQMIELSKANLYLSIGVEFEEVWLEKFASQNPKMKIISLAKGIKKLEMQEAHHDEHEEKHDSEHNHEGLDPHIWTSPKNIKVIASNIYEALSNLDGANKEYYAQNLNKFLAHIDTVNATIVSTLRNVPKESKFMVFHPSWGYFAKEYHLTQLPIEISGKEPKPKELMHIIKEAKEENIKALFTQPEFSDKSATIIAKELNIPVIKVSPLATNWDEQLLKIAQGIAHN